jgi:hypothetical protein
MLVSAIVPRSNEEKGLSSHSLSLYYGETFADSEHWMSLDSFDCLVYCGDRCLSLPRVSLFRQKIYGHAGVSYAKTRSRPRRCNELDSMQGRGSGFIVDYCVELR